jgi:hypothetical protein
MAVIYAQITNPVLNTTLQNRSGFSFYGTLIPGLITLAFVGGALFFIFNFLQGALKWIQSGGDKNAVEEAKDKISKALIGIVILFSLFAVIGVIETFLGTNLRIFNLDTLRIFP